MDLWPFLWEKLLETMAWGDPIFKQIQMIIMPKPGKNKIAGMEM
jgi:hypothetical protein